MTAETLLVDNFIDTPTCDGRTYGNVYSFNGASMNHKALFAYLNHSALNLGQAARDVRYFFDHPQADKVGKQGSGKHIVSSMVSRIPSLAGNLYYAAIPPQLHHSEEELVDITVELRMRDWFLNGYDQSKYPNPQ